MTGTITPGGGGTGGFRETPEGSGTGIASLLESDLPDRDREGYIVGRFGNELLRLRTDSHIVTTAPTGAGKGTSCIIPNLLDHPGSAFVVDIRGETLAATADARRLMGQDIVVLDPYGISDGRWGIDGYDPLATLDYEARDFEDRVAGIARALMFDPEGRASKEPIWDNSTMAVLEGAITYICRYYPQEQHSLIELNEMFLMSERGKAHLVAKLEDIRRRDRDAFNATKLLHAYLTFGSRETKITDNAIVAINTIATWIGRKSFRKTLRTTFSFSHWQTSPMTVYLLVDEYHVRNTMPWVRMLFDAALSSLRHVKDVFDGANSSQLLASQRVLFLLDEFALFGKLDSIARAMATARGRGANLWLFLQHLEQLEQIYGPHDARIMLTNTALLQAFDTQEVSELEYLSRVIGTELYDVESVTIGTTHSSGSTDSSTVTRTITNTDALSRTRGRTTGTSESESTTAGTTRAFTRGSSTSEGRADAVGSTSGTSESYGENTGRAQTRGRTDSEARTLGGDYGFIDNFGVDLPWAWDAKNRTRNEAWTNSHTQSEGQQFSRATNAGRSESTTRSHSFASQESRSEGSSETRGTSSSRSESTNNTSGQTRSRAEAEGESTTSGTTHSEGRTRSTTVTPQEYPVESSRSLRVKLAGSSQLLALRGYHPFIATRATAFDRDPEYGIHRFAHWAVWSGEIALSALVEEWRSAIPFVVSPGLRAAAAEQRPHIPEVLIARADNVAEQSRQAVGSASVDLASAHMREARPLLDAAMAAIEATGTASVEARRLGSANLQAYQHLQLLDALLHRLEARLTPEVEPRSLLDELPASAALHALLDDDRWATWLDAMRSMRRDPPSEPDDLAWLLRRYLPLAQVLCGGSRNELHAMTEFADDLERLSAALGEKIAQIEDRTRARLLAEVRKSGRRRHREYVRHARQR